MNISFNWLKELLDTNLSPEETAKALTRVGLAVDGIHPHADDFILDIDLTSNRPDCLSHLGVARELFVVTASELRTASDTAGENEAQVAPFPSVLAPEVVRIEDPDLCHRFTARIIRGVAIGPSPQWLVDRLEAVGERSINNVADITNYVMLELGQPMHAFDLDRLAEKRIVVRTAKPGETIRTLDEVERSLDQTMLAICDAQKPVAVAGVMGGLDSGITWETTNVLLEVAYFKRESVRSTSRKLNLATEASYRFERGVDIENLVRASDRAAELITAIAGGAAADIIDIYLKPFVPDRVKSKDISAAVKRLAGLRVSGDECIRILSALGISLNDIGNSARLVDSGPMVFLSPSWRHDIAIEEDLVEEVARHTGYEKIVDELPPAYGAGEYQATESRERLLRHSLVNIGFDEAISYSFIDRKHDNVFRPLPGLLDAGAAVPFVELRDSVIEGAVRMRQTLLPGLLDSVRLNINFQRRDLRLFEVGRLFSAAADGGLPHEIEAFALAITGGEVLEGYSEPVRPLDFYDAKGALEQALDAVGCAAVDFRPESIQHHREGQSAAVYLGGEPIGYVGRLNEEIAADYKFKQPVYVAEIDLQAALAKTPKPALYSPLPKYPSVIRDVSFLVKRSLTYSTLRDAAIASGPQILRKVGFVDRFEGKGLADDERSLTLRFEYRDDAGTLTDETVDLAHAEVLNQLEEKLAVRPRI